MGNIGMFRNTGLGNLGGYEKKTMTSKIYIVTRFNAPCFPTRKDLAKRRLDDGWLRERVRLFKEYCYPSVANQSFLDFDWIVWCHPDSPEWMQDELYEITKLRPFRPLIWFIYEDSYYPYIDTDVDTLVTIRLDNDDMIHEDFVKTIHEHIEVFQKSGLPRQVYSFTNGYRYYDCATPKTPRRTLNPDSRFIPEGSLIEAKMHNNPFLTLFADMRQKAVVEKIDIPEGLESTVVQNDHLVYCMNHGWLDKVFKGTHYNDDLAAWIWVYHGGNTASIKVKAGATVDAATILKEFGVEI